MKKSICIMLLLIEVVCIGCSSRKRVLNEKKDIHTETVDSSFISVVKCDSFLLQKLETSKTGIHIIVTEFSLPDSLGKQYPTKVTDININQEEEKQENEVLNSQINAERTDVDKGVVDDKSLVVTKEKKDNRLVPTWVWWLVIGGTIVALIRWLVKRR